MESSRFRIRAPLVIGILLGLTVAAALAWLLVGAVRQARVAVDDGFAFGRRSADSACVAAAVARDGDGGLLAQAIDSLFTLSCLAAARPTPDLCEGVPAFGILSQRPALTWALARCGTAGARLTRCVLNHVQLANHCSRARR